MRARRLAPYLLTVATAVAGCSSNQDNNSGYAPIFLTGGGTDGGGGGYGLPTGDGGASGDGTDRDATAGDGTALDGGAGSGDDAGAPQDAPTGDGGGDGAGPTDDAWSVSDAAADGDAGTSEDGASEDGASEDEASDDAGPGQDAASGDDTSTGGDDSLADGGASDSAVGGDTVTIDSASADSKADSGGGGGFGDDVPWGSEDDAKPYDAGPVAYPDAGAGSVPPAICTPKVAELNLKEEKVGGKVDVIWWIDTSGSMSQEAKYLNENINKFANFIGAANVDFRMILIGNGMGLCVAPPLGGPGCSNGPQYMHVKTGIGSTNGHSVLKTTYAQWKSFLRPDATKNFVAVTDDNSSTNAQWFLTNVIDADPVQFQKSATVPFGMVYHSIVAYDSKADCPTIASKGSVYLELTAKTGGAKHKICLTDWAPIFQALAQSVIQTAKPGCDYNIPYPAGVKPNPNVGVGYVAKDDIFDVPHAAGDACPPGGSGFVFDNPNTPGKITLCPASCELLKGGGNLQFDFGCF